jgi:hypothetical protein
VRQAMADRLTQAEALRAVGELLAAFPNGSPANAKGYIGALAAVLGDYPKSVALRCADIRRGVARETRFLPTVADIVAFCERETAELRGIVDREDHHATLARAQQERAEAEDRAAAVRKARPTYADLKAKYGPDWGITNPDRKPVQSPQDARNALIADIGQAAFDAIPNAPQRQAAE